MPQYELDSTTLPGATAGGATRLVRGRSPEDAARRTLALDASAEVEIGDAELGSGWCEVRVDGAPTARLRPRDRMQFRRD